ncbi:diadenylate cyclase CdaA [Atopococcus tabaci]|uniref:diadenylate cyclase CdaA n=1 Tax=Atopococcus tabaci TaxID=269774 RepID=UPI0004145078|nr:diadenylate cyclase CdaA [Atopococcus tabaci]
MPFDFDWSQLFTWRALINLLDIAIVAFVINQLMKIVKGTRAVQLLKGIGVILLIKFASSFFELRTTEYIVDYVIQWSALALIIIFQPELRRGLEHLGRGSLFPRKRKINPSEQLVQDISRATQYMSRRRIGALMSIEIDTSLEEYIGTGISLDADVSGELLINIFVPNTPLHDGAVILKDFKIASAASYLPLSESPAIPKKLGTRHRAAIGLSEVSDAITVVVSEETGEISVARQGNLISPMTKEELETYLRKELVSEEEDEKNFFQKLAEGFRKGGADK